MVRLATAVDAHRGAGAPVVVGANDRATAGGPVVDRCRRSKVRVAHLEGRAHSACRVIAGNSLARTTCAAAKSGAAQPLGTRRPALRTDAVGAAPIVDRVANIAAKAIVGRSATLARRDTADLRVIGARTFQAIAAVIAGRARFAYVVVAIAGAWRGLAATSAKDGQGDQQRAR